jgi:pimeloyl-ACP methyl ester carboxylesterase
MKRSTFHCNVIRLSVAETGDGKPFVFQHGLCGTASQPAEVFPAGIGWRCVTLECRGHGLSESGNPEEYSIARFSDDLASFINSLNEGPALVGGISMGAAIALRVAITHPELINGLVVARPAWVERSAPENLTPNRLVADLLSTYEPAEALSRFLASPTTAILEREAPDNLASLIKFFDGTRASENQALLSAIANDGPGLSRNSIAGLECRTLVIGHARDAIHPLEMARDIANLIPRAQFVEITPKADSPENYRKDFQGALRRFMTEIERCRGTP